MSTTQKLSTRQLPAQVSGVPGDGAVTDAKLATDVKVGSLAELTTANKANIVAALNELKYSISTVGGGGGSGDMLASVYDSNADGIVDVATTALQLGGVIASLYALKTYVDSAIANLVASSPAALDTLNELATALGNDANFATTTATLLGEKLVKSNNLSDLVSVSSAKINLSLDLVNNTSDANKPVSTAQATADALRALNLLTGYVSGAGTVAATDTVLQAFNKLNGNDGLRALLTGGVFTGATSITTSAVVPLLISGSGAYTRLNMDSVNGNTGLGLFEGGVIKWSIYTSGGDFGFYNNTRSESAIVIAGTTGLLSFAALVGTGNRAVIAAADGSLSTSAAYGIASILTGYSSGTGTVAATDTILQAINKLNGNDALKALNLLTGYVSGSGTVAATDTILQAINKLNGNDALKGPLAGTNTWSAANAFLRVTTAISSSNSTVTAGALELQTQALNNSWLGENTYFDGTNYKFRSTGWATMLAMTTGEASIRISSASGTAGGTVTQVVPFKVLNNQSVAIGGTITATAGSITGAKLVIDNAGVSTFAILAGSGSRMVVADAAGAITATAVYGAASLLTGYTSGAGTVAGTDTILQAVQKLNGNVALKADLDTYAVLTYATTITIGFTQDALKSVTITANTTFATASLTAARSRVLRIICDATSRTFTWPGTWVWIGNAAPTSIAANKTAILSLMSFGTTDADVVAAYSVQL